MKRDLTRTYTSSLSCDYSPPVIAAPEGICSSPVDAVAREECGDVALFTAAGRLSATLFAVCVCRSDGFSVGVGVGVVGVWCASPWFCSVSYPSLVHPCCSCDGTHAPLSVAAATARSGRPRFPAPAQLTAAAARAALTARVALTGHSSGCSHSSCSSHISSTGTSPPLLGPQRAAPALLSETAAAAWLPELRSPTNLSASVGS